MSPISGGNWNNSSNAGVWALNLNNNRANSNNNIGFRSDSDSPHNWKRLHYFQHGGTKGDDFRPVAVIMVKSDCHHVLLVGPEDLNPLDSTVE